LELYSQAQALAACIFLQLPSPHYRIISYQIIIIIIIVYPK
jgi:hypothetical protein